MSDMVSGAISDKFVSHPQLSQPFVQVNYLLGCTPGAGNAAELSDPGRFIGAWTT
jgi:hypothetical protein